MQLTTMIPYVSFMIREKINIHLVDDDVEININNDYIYYNYYCGLILRSYNIFDHLLKNYHNNLINKKEIFNEKIKLL